MLDRARTYGVPALWIRTVYHEGFQNRVITAVVRPGDRSSEEKAPKTYLPLNADLAVRFIVTPGNVESGILPVLMPDDGTTVRVTGFVVKHIGELTPEDLEGTAPDTSTQELVRYHLATVYNTALPALDEVVTIWRFVYRPTATE